MGWEDIVSVCAGLAVAAIGLWLRDIRDKHRDSIAALAKEVSALKSDIAQVENVRVACIEYRNVFAKAELDITQRLAELERQPRKQEPLRPPIRSWRHQSAMVERELANGTAQEPLR